MANDSSPPIVPSEFHTLAQCKIVFLRPGAISVAHISAHIGTHLAGFCTKLLSVLWMQLDYGRRSLAGKILLFRRLGSAKHVSVEVAVG